MVREIDSFIHVNLYIVLCRCVELWHSIPRVAFLAFTKTNKILKEKLL
jgi:hypothetical protein